MDTSNKIPNKLNQNFNSIVADLIYATLMQGNCLGYEQLTLSDSTESTLSVPKNAQIAIIVVESSATSEIVARYIESPDTVVSTTEGMPLGQLGITEIRGKENLQNTKLIATTATQTICNIQYYG